jgi:hypothetical protein
VIFQELIILQGNQAVRKQVTKNTEKHVYVIVSSIAATAAIDSAEGTVSCQLRYFRALGRVGPTPLAICRPKVGCKGQFGQKRHWFRPVAAVAPKFPAAYSRRSSHEGFAPDNSSRSVSPSTALLTSCSSCCSLLPPLAVAVIERESCPSVATAPVDPCALPRIFLDLDRVSWPYATAPSLPRDHVLWYTRSSFWYRLQVLSFRPCTGPCLLQRCRRMAATLPLRPPDLASFSSISSSSQAIKSVAAHRPSGTTGKPVVFTLFTAAAAAALLLPIPRCTNRRYTSTSARSTATITSLSHTV